MYHDLLKVIATTLPTQLSGTFTNLCTLCFVQHCLKLHRENQLSTMEQESKGVREGATETLTSGQAAIFNHSVDYNGLICPLLLKNHRYKTHFAVKDVDRNNLPTDCA